MAKSGSEERGGKIVIAYGTQGMSVVAFDIETGSQSEDDVLRIRGEFRAENVKIGNRGVESGLKKIKEEQENYLRKLIDKAPLEADIGKILTIGIKSEKEEIILEGDEAEMLTTFWEKAFEDYIGGNVIWVGHNIYDFDLPFILRRSMIKRVKIPAPLIPFSRYWDSKFWKDTLTLWAGGKFNQWIGLDQLCRAMGLEGKNGTGKGFQDLYENNREEAIAYARQDIVIQYKLTTEIFKLFQ